MERSYRYLGYFLLLLIPLVFAGFYKTYFVQFPYFQQIRTNAIHIHAFIAAVWVAILITQPFLIANKKVALHRKVGKISYFIYPLLVLSFVPLIIRVYNTGIYRNLFFSIADCTVMTFFYVLAIYYRHQPRKHMRYMICSALMLLGPTVGRIFPNLLGFSDLATQNGQFICIVTILLVLLYHEYRNNKRYGPYLVALVVFSIHQAVFYGIFLG